MTKALRMFYSAFVFAAVLIAACCAAYCATGCSAGGPAPNPLVHVDPEKLPLRLTGAALRPLSGPGDSFGASQSVLDGHIMAVANGFLLELEFSDRLDHLSQELIKSLIQIKGPVDLGFSLERPDASAPNNARVISVFAPECPEGEYQLTVAGTLAGLNTTAMGAPLIIDIQLDAQTRGEFFLLDSSGFYRPISYEESRQGLSLTDTAKTFVIHFNQKINQTSVEDSIYAGLKEQPALVSFSWLTPTQLRAHLTGLQTGLVYHLALEGAVDFKGNGIIGDCAFRTGKASNIGSVDLSSYNMAMIYLFSEERYSAVRSRSILNRVLLESGNGQTWSFGVGTRMLFSLPPLRYDLALPQNYREPVWLGLDQLLGYNQADKTIYIVSVTEGATDPLITLPERPLECGLSPNGRFLAITYRTPPESRKVDLVLVDVQQKAALHHVSSFARPYSTLGGSPTINLTWTGEDSFIYVDNEDIQRAYVSPAGAIMDRTYTIEKDARVIDYLRSENLLLYERSGTDNDTLYLMTRDGKSKRLKNIPTDSIGFYCALIDDETILYQKGDEIFRYSISKQASELIGGGLLLGVSQASDKAYYMMNAEDYGRSSP